MFSPTKLRHIIAVDRAGSITKAANSLNITQSSVTKSVAEIEREIGYDLFDRKSRGVVTTDDGRDFLDRASRIVADLDLLAADAKAGNQSREAVFRIGVCPTSIEGLINRTLKDFIIKNPGICVHLQSASVERGIKNLRRGDIDILFGPVDPIGREADIVTEPIGPIKASIFCRSNHPLTNAARINAQAISDYSIITPDQVSDNVDQIRRLYESSGKNPERHLYVIESFPMVSDIVASTDLLAIVSQSYANSAAFQRRFKQLDIDLFEPMDLACSYKSGRSVSKHMRSFIQALIESPPA